MVLGNLSTKNYHYTELPIEKLCTPVEFIIIQGCLISPVQMMNII